MNDNELLEAAKLLKSKCLSCKDCSLGIADNDNQNERHVYAVGNLAAKVFFVGQNPGYDETRLKNPFVGKSGELFNNHILAPLGLSRDDVWITNSALCYSKNNRRPDNKEVDICSRHFVDQINLIKPRLIVVMGISPLYLLLGIDAGITKMAGNCYYSDKYNVEVFVLMHPSYYLRLEDYDLLCGHVNKLKNKLGD